MRAGRITASRKIELIEVPAPRCEEGQALVRLERGCLCGSDLPYFAYDFDQLQKDGLRPCANRVVYGGKTTYPLRPGLSLHECAGTIVESRTPKFSAGDFVLALPLDHNGFFEYLALPEARLFPLPVDRVSKDEILLSQPLGTVLHGFRKLPEVEGKTVVVVGQGPIGLMMSAVLALRKAGRIIAIERVSERLAVAGKMGATDLIAATDHDAVAAVAELTGGRMADIVIEAVGHREIAIDLSLDLVREDGHVLLFGVIDTPCLDRFPIGKAFHRNLTLSSSVGAHKAEHFLPAAGLIDSGAIDVTPLITHRFPLAEAQRAHELFVDRREGAIKVILDFEAS